MPDKQNLKLEDVQNQLADLNETLEHEKVELTPEIERYIEENARRVHEMLNSGKPIYPSDLEFIEDILTWIDLPDLFRKKFESIEQMIGSEEMQESTKKGITLLQWCDLLELAYLTNNFDISWIDENFKFKDNRIIHKNILQLSDNHKIKKLPEGLQARSIDLSNCNNLMSLPKGVEVQILTIIYCINLTCLPKDIKINDTLNITSNMHPQVIEDAKRLEKKQGFKLIIY